MKPLSVLLLAALLLADESHREEFDWIGGGSYTARCFNANVRRSENMRTLKATVDVLDGCPASEPHLLVKVRFRVRGKVYIRTEIGKVRGLDGTRFFSEVEFGIPEQSEIVRISVEFVPGVVEVKP